MIVGKWQFDHLEGFVKPDVLPEVAVVVGVEANRDRVDDVDSDFSVVGVFQFHTEEIGLNVLDADRCNWLGKKANLSYDLRSVRFFCSLILSSLCSCLIFGPSISLTVTDSTSSVASISTNPLVNSLLGRTMDNC